jgi:hypothetical protein
MLGSTAQVPIIKPAQEHKCNTKTIQTRNNKSGKINEENKNNKYNDIKKTTI